MDAPLAQNLLQELATMAQIGAHAAQMMSVPISARLGREMLADLEAWRALNWDGKPLEEGRVMAMKKRAEEAAAADVARAKAQVAKADMATQGPLLWGKWHRRARARNGNITDAAAILAELEWIRKEVWRELPCGECKRHFSALVTQFFPAGFGNYFETTVAVHNAVNERLEKPIMTQAEAMERWAT